MSSPPPPQGPSLSPDGKFYWDGARWQPMPEARHTQSDSNRPWIVVALVTAAVLVVAGLIWYFGFYDTANGRCSRGDLGACLVSYAEASASASASSANAAQQSFAASGCTVGPGDGSHNVRLIVSDTASPNVQADTCNQLLLQGWAVAPDVTGATEVCQHVAQDGNTVTVTDTGGQYYGGLACQQLNQGQLPSWPIS